MARILLGAGMALLATASIGSARAGAWPAPEDGQQIWTTAAGEREGVAVLETSAYWEVPVGEGNSVVAAPWVEQANDLENLWRGEAVLGLKRVLFRGESRVMAAQMGAFWRSDPAFGCSEGGIEGRWLGGQSLGPGFVNLEVAARLLEGGCESGLIDLTAGWRPAENWLGLGELFFEAQGDGDQSLKLQFSLTRFDLSGRGVQVGVRVRVDGGEAEPALVVALWSSAVD